MKLRILAVFLVACALFAVSSFSQENINGSVCPDTEGLRNIVLNEFGIVIHDDCVLDSEQLEVIYYILKSVPETLYNVSVITTYDTNAYPDITEACESGVIRISDTWVDESVEDNIPDGIEQYADSFSINFVHELNRNIREKFSCDNQEFAARENELLYQAGTESANYIRSDYPDGFFLENQEEFFPSIADAYLQDSYLTFNLTLQRFEEGYSEPVNQFIFFADVYSEGSNKTRFYAISENGFITEEYADVERNSEDQINSLTFEGYAYLFELDQNGNVLDVYTEPTEPQPYVCDDGTSYGACSETMPMYCEEGELVKKCSVCDCADGYYCEEEDCIAYPVGCSDGTLHGECSQMSPYKCDNGKLVENCTVCGCYPYSFCHENGSCQYNQTTRKNPPVLDPIGYNEVMEGEPLEFVVYGYDIEQDVLLYYVSVLPEGASFNVTSREFRWVPDYDQAGSYEIIFTVSDGEFNDSEKIVVEVIDMNRKPEAYISYPSDNQEFYVDEVIQFSGKGSRDADNDLLVYAWDFGDGNTGEGLAVNHTYGNPGTYNVTLEVNDNDLSGKDSVTLRIRPREEPILDDDRDGVENVEDRCPDTSLESVNIYGCPLPEYEKFKNNLTTDFSTTDLIGASNVTIGIPEMGKIEFRKNELNLTGKNLDAYVDIEFMNVSVRTENLPELNKSAVISFYNVEIEDPVIVRDGIYCHDCKILSYVNNTFTFSVPHFTRYSLMAWASYSGYCGDGFCSIYETCYDCGVDCGECRDIEAPSECEEYWMCGPWSECSELYLRGRECNDVNLCGTERAKPIEVMECKDEGFPSLTLFGAIVFILASVYLITDHYRKKKELRKLSRYELHEVIKGYMYRGFTKAEIRKVLRSKGYTDKEIKKLIKEVESDVF